MMTHPRTVRWAPLLIAALGAIAARLIAHFALGDVPHVMDEIAYVFQAKTYLTGHLTVPVSLPRAAFALWFVDDRASKYGIFPPGWPAVMALGVALHARAWVNPLLHGATTILVAASAKKLAGPRAKVLAALVYGLSPQALFLAASLMSHTVVAFGAALALRGGIASNTGKMSRSAIAFGGAGVALALLARPLCGVVAAIALGALLLIALLRRKIDLLTCALAAAPIVVGVAVLLAYNHAITGHALRFPQTVWFDEHAPPMDDPFFRYRPGCNELGFGPGHGCDEGIKNAAHDLSNALSNTGDNLTSWFFLAGGGPLALLAPIFAIAIARSRRKKILIGVATPIAAAIVLYALYWYAGTCFGARFYHAALPSLLVLGGVALAKIDRWRKRATMWGALLWLALSVPGFVMGLSEMQDHYWGVDDRFVHVAEQWNKGPAVVMVAFRTDGLPMHMLHVTGFTSHSPHSVWHNSVRVLGALILNSPNVQDDMHNEEIIFAKFHPALVPELREKYPNRAFYMYLAGDFPANDVIEPYRANKWSDSSAPPPKENFDGYVTPDTGTHR